ncbi:hypothetical protein EDB89DRAFT_2246971 [Lactarius sanguifluus]|nr:hypothetical protein EDB89DRAFT_2246971 [Lactarius sanguifluus]
MANRMVFIRAVIVLLLVVCTLATPLPVPADWNKLACYRNGRWILAGSGTNQQGREHPEREFVRETSPEILAPDIHNSKCAKDGHGGWLAQSDFPSRKIAQVALRIADEADVSGCCRFTGCGYLGGMKAARFARRASPVVESMRIKRNSQVADWQIGESVKKGEGATGVTTHGE